jgi:hypothetical protein
MSIQSKRAAVVIALMTVFLAVRMTRGIVRTVPITGVAVSFDPAGAVVVFVAVLVIAGLVYSISKRSSRRPHARR